MKKILSLLAVLSVTFFTFLTSADNPYDTQIDSLKQSHRIIFFGDGDRPHNDSVRALVDLFYYDQFQHSQDPRAPYFLFMSKDDKLAMGIGGVVRMRGWADWSGVIDYNGFIPYAISIPKDEVHRKKIASTPAGTALYFRVIGRHNQFGNYQLYIEANFDGYQSRDFHLKKAYATVNDWTIGYAPSSFCDPVTNPPVIDAQGPSAMVQTTAVLVRWQHNVHKNWSIASSIEMPASQVGGDNVTTEAIDDWFPNVAAFGQYQWGKNEHIRLSGIMRVLPYRDLVAGENRNKIGWGVQMSSVFRPVEPLTLYATVNGGCGYGSFTGDLIMGNFDLINNPNDEGRMYAPGAFAWFGSAQYHFRPNLFASATIGQERFLPSHEVTGDTYKYGLYSAFNVSWNPSPRLQLAAEANFGKRKNFNGESNWARRACMMIQFSF